MIKANCDNKKCGKEIEDRGAILWSVPDQEEMCKKTHLCRKCYRGIMKEIK